MAQLEEWVRLNLFLPNNNAGEATAVSGVISIVTSRFGGGTHSAEHSPLFRGYWREGNQIIRDNIVLVVTDAPLRRSELSPVLLKLKQEVSQEYERVGQPQGDIWITAEPVYLVVG